MRRFPLALIGALAVLYTASGCSKPVGNLADLAHGPMAALTVSANPSPAPAVPFKDTAGTQHTLADFKGKVTLVNFWAIWCPPCKAEIPSLAALAKAESDKPVAIVTINLGKGEDEGAGRAFIGRNPPLIFYTDPSYSLAYALKPPAGDLPVTLILDKHGVERARLAGGADWSTPEAKAVIASLLAQP